MMYSKKELLLWTQLSSCQEGRYRDVFHRIFKHSLFCGKNLFLMPFEERDFFLRIQCHCTEKQLLGVQEIFEQRNIEKAAEENKRILEECIRNKVELLFLGEEKYPSSLRALSTAPYVLFIKGSLCEVEESKRIALIGTRYPSPKGENFAQELGKYLKEKKYYNISGLARGIDSIGHIETLGRTGAIVGQGLLTELYPKENKYLADQILDTGGFILSELCPYEKVSKFSLLKRNRLQSALTFGIIIAETNLQGGTVQTFRYAKAQGKEIYVASFNQEFIKKYNEDIHVLEKMEDLEKKRKTKLLQQKFSW